MMALGIVRRWSWVPLVAGVAFSYGCSSSPASDDDSAGCSKDTDCANGRICEDHKCVDDPNQGGVLGGTGGSSGSNGTSASGGTMNGTGGTSMPGNGGTGGSSKGGSGGTGGSSGTANGGSSSGSGGTANSGTGGSSGGTAGTSGTSGAGTCSDDDPASCPTADSMTFCSGGELLTFTCDDYCGTLGFPTGPCAAPDGCACDWANPTDETCVIATNAVCGCFDGTDTPCVEEVDPNNPDSIYFYPPYIYATCHGGGEEDMTFLQCIADQAQLDPAPTCGDAFDACGAGSGGTGGTGGTGGAAGAAP